VFHPRLELIDRCPIHSYRRDSPRQSIRGLRRISDWHRMRSQSLLSKIELRGVCKSYGPNVAALQGIDLVVGQGERVAVLGPSGSGKSTLLRVIAGLERPDAGSVWIEGGNMTEVPPYRRDVAMVFQNPALYPHLSVLDNMAFSVRARGTPKAERLRRISLIAETLGIEHLLGRRPADLSGGERQRVALGRAVIREPRVLLLDEPFASLDDPLRVSLREEVVKLHRQLGLTLVHVTHDQSEALALGDRIAVLHQGRLMQYGSPREIYDRPVHRFVASFVGRPGMDLLRCEVAREEGFLVVRLLGADAETSWLVPARELDFPGLLQGEARQVEMGVRSAMIITAPNSFEMGPDCYRAPAIVRRLEYQGGFTLLATLSLGTQEIHALITAGPNAREGQHLNVYFDLGLASWFDVETGLRWEPIAETAATG
jgi:multiple sugar transport system ATP-binding protein